MGRLAVEGERKIYFEHYRGSGRPVVLVHGWGMSARIWDTVLPALLVAGHEVALFDHRGCGSSEKDFDDVSIGAIGSDVVTLVDHLDLRAPILSGWSLGGAVVVDAAVKLGTNLGALVLTGGATPRYTMAEGYPYGGTMEGVEQTLALLHADRASFLANLSGAICHAPVGQPVVDWIWSIFMQSSPRADDSLRDLAEIDQRVAMASITCPALVIAGTHDAIVPFDISVVASKTLGDARLAEFTESGHAPFLEENPRYCEELLSFVAKL